MSFVHQRGRRVRLTALLAVVVAVAACSSDDGNADPDISTTSATSSVNTVPVPTIPPQAGGEQALLIAALKWDPEGECIYGVIDADTEGLPLVFPTGYAALADRHAIVDETGVVVAAEGDRVDLGGGAHEIVDGSVEGFDVSNVPCPDGPVWVVQHSIKPASE